jgi:hypothetical protein
MIESKSLRRLNALRAKTAKNAESHARIRANYPKASEGYEERIAPTDWRKVRRPCERSRSNGSWGEKGEFYLDRFPDWRDIGTAHEVSRREGSRAVEHDGWFCDSFQSETVKGHVLQLPARKGVPQYVPAVSWSDQDGVTLYPLDRHDSALDAARSADGYAERIAESERDYAEASDARQQWDSLGEELAEEKAERRRARAALAALRGQRGEAFTIARQTLNRALAASLEASAELQEKADELHSQNSDHDGWNP